VRKVLRMTDGWIGRLNTADLALIITVGAVLLAGFGGIPGNRAAFAGDLSDPPPEQSEVRVTFSPDPAKTGFVGDGAGNFQSALLRHIIATVSPPSARDDITFSRMYEADGTGRIGDFWATIVDGADDAWEFDVGGTYESSTNYPWGDIILLAWYKNSKDVGTGRVIVQIPYKIGTPHEQKSGAVAPHNIGMNINSSPSAPLAANLARLVTSYYQEITVTVVDQFGELLQDEYAGQGVSELMGTWMPLNQNLASDSTYVDRCGGCTELYIGGADPIVPYNGPERAAWESQNAFVIYGQPIPANLILPLNTLQDTSTIDVKVAGHVLVEGVVNRTVTCTAPDQVGVVWPN
jgi:hypothetical protein